MKNNALIWVVVLILIALGAFFIMNKKLEAPDSTESTQSGDSSPYGDDVVENGIDLSVGVAAGTVKEFTVSAKNFSFTPSSMKVKKGDRVKITFNNTDGFHDFRIDEYGVATKQAQAPTTEVLEFTADKAGSFEYYCSVGTHRSMGMKGALIVE